MTKKTSYEDNPFGDVKLGKRVFLPQLSTPEQLASAEKTVKITMSITERSLDYFKQQASKHGIPYQAMIRRLLDEYSNRH